MTRDGVKRLLRWSWLLVAIAILYGATTVFMRWRQTEQIEAAAEQKQDAADARIVERYGNGELRILTLYASPPVVSRGEKTLLCYGVSNAKSVRIEPAIPDVSPAISRCVEARPVKNTTYRLIASDAAGVEQQREIAVQVR